MIKEISPFLVNMRDTLENVLERINHLGEGVAILVDDDGRFRQTVTDGDLRRLILKTHSLDVTLECLPRVDSVTCLERTEPNQALEIMVTRQIEHLPVITDDGRPVGLFVRRELDDRILLSTPHMSDHEYEYIEEAFRTNWIAPLGPNVDAFEKEIVSYTGGGYAAATNSGTAAIHLALILLGVQAGDRVFCSTFTFVASANPILYQGAIPVFIDSELESWNMSVNALERALEDAKKLNQLPKAVVVANIYGQSADFDRILDLCNHFDIPVIEDAAESLGATYKGKASGTLGRIGIFSFNGNKVITTSGGGMLVSDEIELVERAKFLSTQSREESQYYVHREIGYNYRMSNVLAGIGRGQLKVLADRVKARQDVFHLYRQELSHHEHIQWMPESEYGECTHWLTAFTIDSTCSSIKPGDVIQKLRSENIEARHVWNPLHRQPLFEGCAYYRHGEKSVSDDLFEAGVCLPSSSNLSKTQQFRIIEVLDKILSGN